MLKLTLTNINECCYVQFIISSVKCKVLPIYLFIQYPQIHWQSNTHSCDLKISSALVR